MSRVIPALVAMIFALVVIVLFGALAALPVMWLWNYLLTGETSVIGTPLATLDFWHAWALLVLCNILFKSDNSNSK